MKQYGDSSCTLSGGTFDMLITDTCGRLEIFRRFPMCLVECTARCILANSWANEPDVHKLVVPRM